MDTPRSRWAQREPLFFSKFFAINNMESNFLDTAIFRFSPIHLLYYVILSPMKSFGRNWSCNVLNCVCVYITIERFRLAYSLNKTRRYSSSGSILISMAGPRLGIADGIGCNFLYPCIPKLSGRTYGQCLTKISYTSRIVHQMEWGIPPKS